jgi:hypothetical protein
MKYLVPDDFAGGCGWTADKLAEALKAPLARIGVIVERVPGHGGGGFQAPVYRRSTTRPSLIK